MGVEPLEATFGARVSDVDLRAIDSATWVELYAIWLEYALLVFPGQFLSKQDQVAFAGRFGDLELVYVPIGNLMKDGSVLTDPDHDVAKVMRGNEGWHHDSTYMPVQAKGAVFSADVVPASGGATEWADMRAAYDDLDELTRGRVEEMTAAHSLFYSQARVNAMPSQQADGSYLAYGYHDGEPSRRSLVKVHPETGRPNLVIGRHAHAIGGMEPSESERFLDDLHAWACQPPRVHRHEWSEGDTVLWDNRRLMHRATPYDLSEPRRMWHSRIAGDPATESAISPVEETSDT